MSAVKVYPNELIGEKITVVDATNKEFVGLQGEVIDETKASLKISSNGDEKVLLKNGITIKLNKTGEVILGEDISKKPEDRLKGK
jgi:ribonuclease P protein subunit POP4